MDHTQSVSACYITRAKPFHWDLGLGRVEMGWHFKCMRLDFSVFPCGVTKMADSSVCQVDRTSIPWLSHALNKQYSSTIQNRKVRLAVRTGLKTGPALRCEGVRDSTAQSVYVDTKMRLNV